MTRRTKAEIRAFDDAIFWIVDHVKPATCRQIYYRAVVAGLVAKDDRGYRWVCESLRRLRWDGTVKWEWIADETRAVRAPQAWADADTGIAGFAERYRRDAWREQPVWVEVWCESDSLAGTLVDVTWELGVPLFSGRGFQSLTATRTAAQQISDRWDEREQPTMVLYVGDLDPAGWAASPAAHRMLLRHLGDIRHDIDEEKAGYLPGDVLLEYGEDAMLGFHRLAVNPEDVEAYQLPTGGKPKRKGPGSKSWWSDDGPRLGYTVEAEALEPDVMRDMVHAAILEHADVGALDAVRQAEALERESLRRVAARGLFTVLERHDDRRPL